MKQNISKATITKKDDDWDRWGLLSKALEGKNRSERIQEMVERDLKRLERKLLAEENKDNKLLKSMHRR